MLYRTITRFFAYGYAITDASKVWYFNMFKINVTVAVIGGQICYITIENLQIGASTVWLKDIFSNLLMTSSMEEITIFWQGRGKLKWLTYIMRNLFSLISFPFVSQNYNTWCRSLNTAKTVNVSLWTNLTD